MILITAILSLIFSFKLLENKYSKLLISGIFNKLLLFLILFFATFENYIIGLLGMIILLELIYSDNINNESFQCKFYEDNREP
jgi:hypothetical protein